MSRQLSQHVGAVRVVVGGICIALSMLSSPALAGQPQTSSAPGVPGQTPPRGATPAQTSGTAVIRGRVVERETGQPLRRAQVRVFAPELRESRVATTDEQGRYEIKDLPAGRYTLTASKGSYVGLSFGQPRPFDSGRPLEILDTQTVDKVDFALPRGSVITGRIVDEYGDAVPNVQVAAMRYQFAQGKRRLIPSNRSATSDDAGEFRLFGLPPAQYYVSATLRSAGGAPDDDDRAGYAVTYFPATTNAAEAQRVTIGIAQAVGDITIALVPTRTARVTGTAVDSRGRPMSGAFVNMMARDNMFFTGTMMGSPVRPDGAFTITGVTPGTYTLRAQAPPVAGGLLEVATADVTVSAEDITGLQLAVQPPGTVAGRIVVDPAAAAPLPPSALRIFVMPKEEQGGVVFVSASPPGGVKDDLTFEVKAPAGKSSISVTPMPRGWTTKAVRVNGVDVTDAGTNIKSNETLGGIEIELTDRVTDVSGQVVNSRGEAVKEYTVVVFARDRDKWEGRTRYIQTGRPDQDGRFKIRALPAGDYYAIAVDYVEPGQSSDPELLERMRTRALSFSLSEGEAKVLDLKLAPPLLP